MKWPHYKPFEEEMGELMGSLRNRLNFTFGDFHAKFDWGEP
jgi:hypothetical protein